MDGRTPSTTVKALQPDRPLGGADRAAYWRPDASGVTQRHGFRSDRFGLAEIFKKPPCVADSKPGGRYVAKDMPEVVSVPWHDVFDTELSGEGDAARTTRWAPRATNPTSGMLWKFVQQVGAVADRAVVHSGGAHEKQCYVDI